MRQTTDAAKAGFRKTTVSLLLGGVVALTLAGCHVDPIKSSSGGGSVSAAPPKTNTQNNSGGGTIRPTPAPTPVQTPTTAANNATISCGGFPGGGMVYKPHSEGDGNLVVLIQSFQAESTGAAMADRNGNVIERGRFVGRTNGNRPTYRFSRHGSSFPSPGILIVGGANICIPNTGQRYD